MFGVDQLDVVDGVEPQDCLEGSAIIKTSIIQPLCSEAGSGHHKCIIKFLLLLMLSGEGGGGIITFGVLGSSL